MPENLCDENHSQLDLLDWADSRKVLPKSEQPNVTEERADGQERRCRVCGKPLTLRQKTACSRSCNGNWRGPHSRKELPLRLWPRLKIADNGCWEWQGGLDKDGYGQLAAPEESRAHRVAWFLVNGPIPEGLRVLHRCDNPPCCNPLHLFLGDNLANSRDMVNKGRSMAGIKNAFSKLTTEQVIEIRKRRAEGILLNDLAEEFSVAFSTISKISLKKAWKHV